MARNSGSLAVKCDFCTFKYFYCMRACIFLKTCANILL